MDNGIQDLAGQQLVPIKVELTALHDAGGELIDPFDGVTAVLVVQIGFAQFFAASIDDLL